MAGWTAPGILSALSDTVHRLQPDIVAIAGNLTASGQSREFQIAQIFLDSLPSPQIVVPGEKDFPRLGQLSRLMNSSGGFSKHIESSPVPYFADRELVVVGVDSSSTSKKNSVGEAELSEIHRVLESADPGAIKVLVSYREVFLPDLFAPRPEDDRVFRSVFDIQLGGPLERTAGSQGARSSDTTLFFPCASRPEGLGFHLVRIDKPQITIERYGWQVANGEFRLLGSDSYALSAEQETA